MTDRHESSPPHTGLEAARDSESLIPLARPALGDDEARATRRVLRSGRLVLGPENQHFEKRLATLSSRVHAICVSSGTTALELALWALSLADPKGRPDARPRAIVPAAGFPAAANAVLRLGGEPVAVDIDPATWTLDIAATRAALTPAVRAIISIDTFGAVAEAEPLKRLAEESGAALVADAACSLGARDSRAVPGGGYGVVGTFSFHPRKLITTGEGGAVVCDDDELAARLRQLRNQGQSFAAGRARRFVQPGTNARLSEIAAAIGCIQLDRLDALLRERDLLCAGYHERLGDLAARGRLSWQQFAPGARPARQTFAVLLPQGCDRARVQSHMAACGIETGVAAFALNRLDCYAELPGIGDRRFPVAEALHDRGLALPLFPGMRSAQLDQVTEALTEALLENRVEAQP